MKKLATVALIALTAVSLAACSTIGKGKGKGPASPIVTKG